MYTIDLTTVRNNHKRCNELPANREVERQYNLEKCRLCDVLSTRAGTHPAQGVSSKLRKILDI